MAGYSGGSSPGNHPSLRLLLASPHPCALGRCSSTLRDSGGYQARDDVAIPLSSCNHAYCVPCLTLSVASAIAKGGTFQCCVGGCSTVIGSWEVHPPHVLVTAAL